jgi:K+-transporting ATPase KdpF subunit
MSILYLIGAVVSIGLLAYLFVALLNPEGLS